MNRRTLIAAGALALALVAASCSTVRPDAARVDGTSITQADFEDQLQAIADDPLFLPQRPITNPATGQVGNDFARQLLFVNAFGAFARAKNDAAGVAPSTEDAFVQQVRTQTAQVMGFDPGSGQWAAVSDEVRQPVEDEVAQILTLFTVYGAEADDPAAVQAYFDENASRFALLCARHILVPTEAEALAVIDRLDAGEDFGAVAAEVSTDTGSGADGGRLYLDGQDCPPASGYIEEFTAGAFATAIGEVSEPVESQFGWHVIIPDQVVERPFAEVEAEVVDAMRTGTSARAVADFAAADVWVNPRFGVWDAEQGFIEAPAASSVQG